MQSTVNSKDKDRSVFVWGHFGEKLEQLDKERFIFIAQSNPSISLHRYYNIKVNILVKGITDIRNNFNKLTDTQKEENKEKYAKEIQDILNKIENENKLHLIFMEANKVMLGIGDSVSLGSLVTGQLERKVNKGRMVNPDTKYERVTNENE